MGEICQRVAERKSGDFPRERRMLKMCVPSSATLSFAAGLR